MRDIQGFENLYAVTSCGRVWSCRSKKFLKPYPDKKGYLMVKLYKDGEHKHMKIHRLVAEAYLENSDNLPQINHKDEVKTHNWVNNLEFCDAKYNNNFGTRTERCAKAMINDPKRSHRIRCLETGELFDSLNDCERKTGFCHSHLSAHIRGKRYKTIKGLHFERIE